MSRLLFIIAAFSLAGGCNCSNLTEGKQPEICDNGRDDDLNGLTDCADGACFLNAHCFASCLDQCAGNETVCDPNGVRTCQLSSIGCRTFAAAMSCGGSQVCSGGSCVGPPCSNQCTPGAKQCAGLGLPVHCDTLATGCTDWVVDAPCGNGDACSAGVCVPRAQCVSDCPAVGATRCTANGKQQTCEGVPACHQWGLPVSCSGGACACTPDSGSGGGTGGGGSATGGGGSATGGGGSATGGGGSATGGGGSATGGGGGATGGGSAAGGGSATGGGSSTTGGGTGTTGGGTGTTGGGSGTAGGGSGTTGGGSGSCTTSCTNWTECPDPTTGCDVSLGCCVPCGGTDQPCCVDFSAGHFNCQAGDVCGRSIGFNQNESYYCCQDQGDGCCQQGGCGPSTVCSCPMNGLNFCVDPAFAMGGCP